jgi:hypothetical protein
LKPVLKGILNWYKLRQTAAHRACLRSSLHLFCCVFLLLFVLPLITLCFSLRVIQTKDIETIGQKKTKFKVDATGRY